METQPQEIPIKTASDDEPQPVRAENQSSFLAGQTLRFYLKRCLLPAFLAFLVSGIFIYIRRLPTVGIVYSWASLVLMYIFQVIIIGGFVYYFLQRDKLTTRQAGSLAAISALIMAVLVALFRLIWQHQFWQIFNLFFEPFYSTFLGLIVGLLVGRYFRRNI